MQALQGTHHPQDWSSSISSPSSNTLVNTQTRTSCTCNSQSGTCCKYCIGSSFNPSSIQFTPPEDTQSCPSSSESSSTSSSTVFGASPQLRPNFLHPSHSTAPLSNYNYLPKSISESSITSEGSALLFSPFVNSQQIHSYSPSTPPLSLPLETSKEPALSIQTARQAYFTKPFIQGLPPTQPANKLPLLPTMEAKTASSATAALVVTPACISQLATYLAEMMVYLWFSPPQKRLPTFPKPTSAFARFCNDILTTTQVSQSVVVLALYFVSKLQNKHSIEPRAGSEYKLTIASLMLANKILDDHTYTNKTWSEVSGLPLGVLNGAEVEFLQGLEFDLHVSHTAYLAWYTMLQNGESSNIVKQTAPLRKKARVANPIAPSAPTSPLHHTSSSSTHANAGLGFDFTFAVPTTASSAAVIPQIPASRLSLNAWPSTSHLVEAPYMQPTLSTDAITGAAPTSSRKVSSRKRRMSDAALSPPRTAMPPTASHRHPALQVGTDSLPSAHPAPRYALPPHLYTPIVARPTSAMSAAPSSATTPTAHDAHMNQHQAYFMQNFMPADFNTLTSSWSPVDEVGNRLPQDLTYYALAAGQQRGGYLTHQTLQSYSVMPAYSQAGMPLQQVAAGGGRMYAPLPRNTFVDNAKNNSTPVLQPPRMSLSLSPVDVRVIHQYQDGRTYPHSAQFDSQMLAPGQQQFMYSNMSLQNQARLTPPNMSRGSPQGYGYPEQMPSSAFTHHGMAHSQVLPRSPLEPSLQNLALSSGTFNFNNTPMPAARQEQPPPSVMPHQSYYSSFANNGLPGVLSWPAHALAKYHNVVQPHQQAWLRDFS